MARGRRNLWAVSAVVWAAVAGCSTTGPDLYPVSGVVKVDGKTADGVQVSFWPAAGADTDSRDRYGSGVTNHDGRFDLRSMSDKGLLGGEYKVTFSRLLTNGKASTDAKKKTPQTRESLPAKYVDPDATDVTARVAKDQHDFVFDLSSQPR